MKPSRDIVTCQITWFMRSGTRVRAKTHRSGVGPRQRLDEVLELARGPALVGLAVLLVGRDDGVAVVPVQPRLRVEPERAPGERDDRGEDVGARVAAVRARVP